MIEIVYHGSLAMLVESDGIIKFFVAFKVSFGCFGKPSHVADNLMMNMLVVVDNRREEAA